MKNILFTIALLISFISFGQTWKYSEGGNAFDGKYKTSIVTGVGTKFPYESPSLVINRFEGKSINFYISDGGFFQEGTGIGVLWVFDNEPDIIYSTYDFSISSDGKILFFTEFNNPDGSGKLKPIDIIEKLTLASNVTIRMSDNYGSNDIVFSLKGSTKAINFVIPKEERQQMLDSGLAERNSLAQAQAKNQLILDNLMKKANEEKFTSSSLSSLKSKFEQNLGLGYNSGMETGKNYKSILLEAELSDSMFESYGYVDVFYVLNDGSKEQIYGSWTVEMDAPIFVRLKKEEELAKKEEEKEKERVKLILEKYSNEPLQQAILKEINLFSRKGYSKKGQFGFSDVKDVMISLGDFRYGKFWECDMEIKLKNDNIITNKMYVYQLEITKKILKSMGAKAYQKF